MMRRRGKMAWEYIVAIILALLILMLILIFSLDLKDFLAETVSDFFSGMLGL